jgi:hypothetical protein
MGENANRCLFTTFLVFFALVTIALFAAAPFSAIVLGSSIYTVTPTNCDSATYANAESWYTGPWYLIPTHGFCPIDAADHVSVLDFGYTSWGFDDLRVVIFRECISFADESDWSSIDEDNLEEGLLTNLASGSNEWQRAMICVITATGLLSFAYLLAILLCYRKSKCGRFAILALVSASMVMATVLYIIAYYYIANTDQLDTMSWSTSFFETCDVESMRDYGALISFIVGCTALVGSITIILFSLFSSCSAFDFLGVEDAEKTRFGSEDAYDSLKFEDVHLKVDTLSRSEKELSSSAIDRYFKRHDMMNFSDRLQIAGSLSYATVKLVNYQKPQKDEKSGSVRVTFGDVGNHEAPPSRSSLEDEMSNDTGQGTSNDAYDFGISPSQFDMTVRSRPYTDLGMSSRAGMSSRDMHPDVANQAKQKAKREAKTRTGLEGYDGPMGFETVVKKTDCVRNLMIDILDVMNQGRPQVALYRSTQLVVHLRNRVLRDFEEISASDIGSEYLTVSVNPYVAWKCKVHFVDRKALNETRTIILNSRSTCKEATKALAKALSSDAFVHPSQLVLQHNNQRLRLDSALFSCGLGDGSTIMFNLFSADEFLSTDDDDDDDDDGDKDDGEQIPLQLVSDSQDDSEKQMKSAMRSPRLKSSVREDFSVAPDSPVACQKWF